MAQKRMFSLKVVDTDKFLQMPVSARLLYYDLGMRADDDGFVDDWRKILAFTGLKEDDMKILIAKQFILPFDSGVIVIRHWRLNNYLQNDRTNPTIYQDELSQLKYDKKNPIYEMYTSCIHSIDKNSIVYNSTCSSNKTIIENNIKDINRIKEEKETKEKEESIYDYIESNFKRILAPIEIQKIQEWLEVFNEDIIKYAIELAVMNRKSNFKYVEGILKNWKSNSLNTLEEIKQENKSRSKSEKVELFDYDWLNDEDNS